MNEHTDARVVPQEGGLHCGCACVLTVLKVLGVLDLPTQEEVYESGGSQAFTVKTLAVVLNEGNYCHGEWRGGAFEHPNGREALVDQLVGLGPWIAMLWEPGGSLGHFVVVASRHDSLLEILDPWDIGTVYQMTIRDFLDFWTEHAVYLVRDS